MNLSILSISFLLTLMVFMPLTLPQAHAQVFDCKQCTSSNQSYKCQQCVLTPIASPAPTPSPSPSPDYTQAPQFQSTTGKIINGIISTIKNFINGVIGSANIQPESNPAGVSSDKLKDVSNSGFDTLNSSKNLGSSLKKTVTTVLGLAPVKIDPTILWIIGIGITIVFAWLIISRILKHLFLFLGIVIFIIVILMLVAIGNA